MFFTFTMIADLIFALSLPEIIEIKNGEFNMGNNDFITRRRVEDDGVPIVTYEEHPVKLGSFKISKYEITLKEYFEFLNDTQYKTVVEVLHFGGGFKEYFNLSLHQKNPVTRITYEDALMYCLWLQKKTGRTYRLPTEAEWEYAATGGQMILYPWGNEYRQLDTSHINEYNFDATFENDIFSVNKFREDKSIFGVYGMYGNAMEWCLDAYDPLFYNNSPYQNPLQIIRKYYNDMSYRGSAGYSMETGNNNLKSRFFRTPLYYGDLMGFRVVEEIQTTVFNKNTETEGTYYYANGVLNDSNVNARSIPSQKGERLFQLSKGQSVRIYSRSSNKMTIGNLTDYWYCVRKLDTTQESEMATGWIFGAYLNVNEIEF